MATVQDLERVIDDARALVDSVSESDLMVQTPCEEWDVRGLIVHMTGICRMFAGALQDGGDSLAGPPPGGTDAGAGRDQVTAAYAQASSAVLDEFRAPGALDKPIRLPFGESTGGRALGIVLTDQVLHSWDLAKALGRPFSIDESLAEGSLQMMHRMMGSRPRGANQGFGEEIPCPADAPVQDRLLAFSGRQP